MDEIIYALFMAYLTKEFGDHLFTEAERAFIQEITKRKETRVKQVGFINSLVSSGHLSWMSNN